MNRQYGALSGAAVVLIVLNHALHFGNSVSPVEGGWLKAVIALQALGAFAVPIFLFVSGAFLSYAAGALTLRFVKGSLERMLWPYVLWSIIFYVFTFLTGEVRYDLPAYVKSLLVGYPYHFVPLLIFWYLVGPFVTRAGKRHAIVLLAAIGLYQVLLIALRFPGALGLDAPPAWLYVLRPPALFASMAEWGIYVPLGIVLSMHDGTIKPHLLRWRMVAVLATAVLFLLGILNAFRMIAAPWARFAAPLPLMFVLPAIARSSIPWALRLEFIGRRSYGIYLSHFVIIVMLAFALRHLAVPDELPPLLLYPAFFILAFGLSLGLMESAAAMPQTRRLYRYLFGVAPPAHAASRRPA